jgi:helix-turn-helix protein
MTDIQDTAQNNDLTRIGLILRRKREELSYTLEHVSEITRITLTCLRLIEDGNMKALPGLVFVRGFIRNYAKLLGLESDWMIESLNQTYEGGGESKSAKNDAIIQLAESSKSKNKIFYYSLGITLVCVGLIAVYFFYERPAGQLALKSGRVETVQAVASQDEATPQDASELVVPIEEAPVPEAVGPAPVAIISPLTLTIVALENDWIRLAIDGQDPFELRLKQGEKYEWPAEEEYSLVMTTGNTALVHLNGEEIVERENYLEQLYQAKLNKFTLKQINNR